MMKTCFGSTELSVDVQAGFYSLSENEYYINNVNAEWIEHT